MSNKRIGDYSTTSNRQEKDIKCTDTDIAMSTIPGTGNLLWDSSFEEEFGTSSDSCQGAWSNLSKEVVSNLSESVVSVASFNGDKLNCVCTGMIVTYAPRFVHILTSADLLRSPHDSSNFSDRMRITVHLPNGQKVRGFLAHYDLDYNVAFINARSSPGIQEAFLGRQLQIEPQSDVVAVGRGVKSGKLFAAAGIVTDVQTEKYMTTTCKITRCGFGGPLIDFEGNFVGINLYNSKGNAFVPRNKIHKALSIIWDQIERDRIIDKNPLAIQQSLTFTCEDSSSMQMPKITQRRTTKRVSKEKKYSEYVRNISCLPDFRPLPNDDFTKSLKYKLTSYGYPLPITLEGGMRLLYGFEEEFSEDAEIDLPLSIGHDANKYVVSLASFLGGTRIFACTGVFIGHHKSSSRILTSGSLVETADKIDANLEIQVRLPNNEATKGTLEYYDSKFNIAVVSISNFRCRCFLPLNNDIAAQVKPYKDTLVAMGRVFETNKLMSTFGTLTRRKTKLDCQELKISTCKITKAGIGGPVIDYHGNFIGMNFYEKDQTPYLPVDQIKMLLRDFYSKRTDEEVSIACPDPGRRKL